MPVAMKAGTDKYGAFERLLRSRRDELRAHFGKHREDVFVERVPDDEGAEASRNLVEDLAFATLERERRLLNEIESALKRLEKGIFGMCQGCGKVIPERRLRALPWARFCLPCAERRQRHLLN